VAADVVDEPDELLEVSRAEVVVLPLLGARQRHAVADLQEQPARRHLGGTSMSMGRVTSGPRNGLMTTDSSTVSPARTWSLLSQARSRRAVRRSSEKPRIRLIPSTCTGRYSLLRRTWARKATMPEVYWVA